jgi:hypothetical protein
VGLLAIILLPLLFFFFFSLEFYFGKGKKLLIIIIFDVIYIGYVIIDAFYRLMGAGVAVGVGDIAEHDMIVIFIFRPAGIARILPIIGIVWSHEIHCDLIFCELGRAFLAVYCRILDGASANRVGVRQNAHLVCARFARTIKVDTLLIGCNWTLVLVALYCQQAVSGIIGFAGLDLLLAARNPANW